MKEKDSDKLGTEHDHGDEKEKDRERSSRREHDRDRKDVSNGLKIVACVFILRAKITKHLLYYS